jgi:Mycoplasma protein of unknown function, DUF285
VSLVSSGFARDSPDLTLRFSLRRFGKAYEFNQDISSWDVRRGVSFNHMFAYGTISTNWLQLCLAYRSHRQRSLFFVSAYKFNKPVIGWQMNSCVTAEYMFGWLKLFDQPVRLSLVRE